MTLLEKKSDPRLDPRVPLLTRIKFPRIWVRIPGFRVEDLQEDRFDEALEHIKNCYLMDDPLCRTTNILKDEESIDNYLKLIRWWMQDTQSLIAINEETGEIVGTLVERVLDLYLMKTFSNVMNYRGESLCKIQKFRIHMNKSVDLNKIFRVNNYTQIYVWSVNSKYRNLGVPEALLQASILQTKSFKLRIVSIVVTDYSDQAIALDEGFQCMFEFPYNKWERDTKLKFDNAESECKSAMLMVMNISTNPKYRNKHLQEVKERLREAVFKKTKLAKLR
ncbi:uncharacterized protein LOC111056614 [Nilaparvata lugens]|uniref:uncharacterized protein LOC111056614 n=1 Tax=Nilaparvata lugens TaxID=108931 RepID=UPI00193DC5D5|nr:uncharacterized protein LOC111056614 [Nilaparvata lugens]